MKTGARHTLRGVRCPLWIKGDMADLSMSAFPPKADIRRFGCDVAYVPLADIAQIKSKLFWSGFSNYYIEGGVLCHRSVFHQGGGGSVPARSPLRPARKKTGVKSLGNTHAQTFLALDRTTGRARYAKRNSCARLAHDHPALTRPNHDDVRQAGGRLREEVRD